MQSVLERTQSYVIEIDGKFGSTYGIFVEALKAGLELKQKFPHSRIKVHDAEYDRNQKLNVGLSG